MKIIKETVVADLDKLQDYVDSLTLPQVAAQIAVIKTLTDRFKQLDKLLRAHYADRHTDADGTINVMVNQQNVGNITVTKEGVGSYVVKDKEAYGAILHDIEATIPGGQSAVEQKWIPRKEACTAKYLDQLIADHGGEIPDGVEYKPGRSKTVVYKNNSRDGFPVSIEDLANTLKEIEQ